MGFRWTGIYVIMHVYLLAMIWDQMRDGWDMYKGPHRGSHFPIQLCEGGYMDLVDEVEKQTCMYTYINIGRTA